MTELFICGDIVNYKNDDGLICSEAMSNIISSADFSICNFEAPIEGFGIPIVKSGSHHSQRIETIRGLKKQGFDLLCLANNHIFDYGIDGIIETKSLAVKNNLETIGAGINLEEAYKPLVKEIGGIRLGFINASEAQFGVINYSSKKDDSGYAWINHSKIDNLVIELKRKCDFVIVLPHAGLEHYSIPQIDWRYRYKQLCDLGADLVVASHPHVPQGYEKYKDSLICYSLGNFYFDSKNYIDKRDDSFSLLIKFYDDKTFSFKPIYHHKENFKVVLTTAKERRIDLLDLNILLEKNYNKVHDEMTIEIYKKRLKRNLIYSLVPIPYDGTALTSIKRIINNWLKRTKRTNKNIQALHLIRNETYQNVYKHALELISKGKNGGEL